jgi:cytochrome c oxidase subunit 4
LDILEDPYHRHRPEEQHVGPTFGVYMVIFAVLSVCTAVSFIANWIERGGGITIYTAVLIIMIVAIIKATLVTMYFMHLKWDWNRIFFILIPLMILTVMMIVVLLPDVSLSELPQPGGADEQMVDHLLKISK